MLSNSHPRGTNRNFSCHIRHDLKPTRRRKLFPKATRRSDSTGLVQPRLVLTLPRLAASGQY